MMQVVIVVVLAVAWFTFGWAAAKLYYTNKLDALTQEDNDE